MKKYKSAILFILTLLLYSFTHTSERNPIYDLSIVDESNLNQIKTKSPTFSWNLSERVKSNIYSFFLYTLEDGKISLIWKNEEVQIMDENFKLDVPDLLKEGKKHLFAVSVKIGRRKFSAPCSLQFRINTPPSTPDINILNDTIISSPLIKLPLKISRDNEIKSKDIWYQIVFSLDTGLVSTEFDTMLRITSHKEEIIIPNIFSEDTYYFVKVRAFDGVEYSNWSTVKRIFISMVDHPPLPFEIIDNLPDTVSKSFTLKWKKSNDPEKPLDNYLRYELTVMGKKFTTNDTSIFINIDSLRNHFTYHLKCYAIDMTGNRRASSNSITFVVNKGNTPPEYPELISPIGGSPVTPQNFITFLQKKDKDNDVLNYKILIFNGGKDSIICSRSVSIKDFDGKNAIKTWINDSVQKIQLRYSIIDTGILKEGNVYRLQISVDDGWGGQIITNWNNSIFIFDDGVNNPPSAPESGFYPDNTVVNTDKPILRWDSSMDSDVIERLHYEVIISQDSTFSGGKFYLLKTKDEIPMIKLSSSLLENKKYYWKVRAYDMHNARSYWSKTNYFWVNKINEPPIGPVLQIYPPDLTEINYKGFFSWIATTDPDPFDTIKYILEIDNDPNFLTPKVIKEYTPDSRKKEYSIYLSDLGANSLLDENSLYYWRVIAVDRYGIKSMSPTFYPRFIYNNQNEPPQEPKGYFYPADGLIVKGKNTTIKWNHAKDPDFSDIPTTIRYEVQLSTDSNFIDTTINLFTKEGENFLRIPINLKDNITWFYRIRSIDRAGYYSKWSKINYFILDLIKEPPYSVTEGFLPSDSMVVDNLKPIISWLPVTDPDPLSSPKQIKYKIQYWSLEKKDKKYIIETETGENTCQIGPLKEDKLYAYRIKAVDPDNNESVWSRTIIFGVNSKDSPPVNFNILYPLPGQDTTNVDPTFKWEASYDPDPFDNIFYKFYLSDDSLFNTYLIETVVEHSDSNTITYKLTFPLEFNKKYFWKVSAIDKSGNITWGSNSDKSPFTFKTRMEYYLSDYNPNDFNLRQNTPNPFNISTRIDYYVPKYGNIELTIYNLLGKKIKTLASGYHSPGNYSVNWDGTDDFGAPVPGGVYICRMEARGFSANIKMLLLR
ncbi:MAG: hypothetical protein H0Z29_07775 [Candidatus Marinimicrobia bacterium]|nr:hypothetical protein [Candidatus Neomarinimicrobiota bacterium]